MKPVKIIPWLIFLLACVCLSHGQQLDSADVEDSENRQQEKSKMVEYLERIRKEVKGLVKTVTCEACHFVMKLVQHIVKTVDKDPALTSLLDPGFPATVFVYCKTQKLQTDRICKFIVEEYKDDVLYVARHLTLEPWKACSLLLSIPCEGKYYPGLPWSVNLTTTPKPKPTAPIPPKPSSPTLKVLHFTDLHLDLQYKVGSKVHCKEPLCCRDNNGEGVQKDDMAGMFGHYGKCDIPEETAQSIFEHLSAKNETFDFAIFTGDIPAHDVWNQTRDDQLQHIHYLEDLFQRYLPGVPVYYTVGNHEAAPCNSFVIPDMEDRNMTWLYEPLANVWGRASLSESALDMIKSCASYSVSPFKGFKIISVNNNYCNKENLWLLLNDRDPCGTLEWLVTELQDSEDKDEKVHILTHIPPGSGVCLKYWSYNYYDIINRYENTVVNQFYGHNHRDWFQMFYDNKDFKRPVGFGFVTPAVTSRDRTNPMYRVYTVDGNYEGSSWAVLDYTNYFLNLTKANKCGQAKWEEAYNPKTDLQMENLFPNDWEDLIKRMETDDDLFKKFYLYYNNMNVVDDCDEHCKKDLLCDLKQGRSYDPHLCDTHDSKLDQR